MRGLITVWLVVATFSLLALAHSVNHLRMEMEKGYWKIMSVLDALEAAVVSENTVIDSAVVLLEQLSELLNAAIASGDPARLQAVVDAIDAKKDALAAAIVTNTPQEPPVL